MKVSKSQQCIFTIQNISGGKAKKNMSDNDSGEGAICLEDFVDVANP
jgi:hypothetical protein